MPRTIDPKKIKSAKRVLEVFEFFNETRRKATVMEVAREYGYPQSSTSELLSCLVELGFLHRDRSARTYRPSARVAMLGAWVHPRLMRHGNLLTMMDTLAEETGCTIVLGGAAGLSVQHLHIVGDGALPSPPSVLTHGVMGRLLLSIYDRFHIRKLVHRLNAETESAADRVSCDDLLAEIDQIRRLGFAASPGLAEGAGGMCAVILPQSAADEPLALSVVVKPGDERGADHFVRALRNAVATHLGPTLAHRQLDQEMPRRQAY